MTRRRPLGYSSLAMRLPWLLLLCACATPVLKPMPDDFHWGVAMSGFQSEGTFPDSNWTRYAKNPKFHHEPYRKSVDFFHRYKEDLQRAADLGVNTFRFSIEWARVMPKPGQVDDAALAYYDAIFEELDKHHMTPMVTLLHFVLPGWVMDRGGLSSEQILRDFAEFTELVTRRYANRGVWWLVVNEPSYFYRLELAHGSIKPGEEAHAKARIIGMHRLGWDLIKANDPKGLVSSNTTWEPPPASWIDDWFFDEVKDRLDYISFDYYYSLAWSLSPLSPLHALRNEFWRIRMTPWSMLGAIESFHARAPDLPIYIAENGMPTDDGKARFDRLTRAQHLREHVLQLHLAQAEGIKVVGYNYWSLTDNYEWGDYRNRFGLYTVDVNWDRSLRRRPTSGVAAYREIIKHHGVVEPDGK